MHTPDLLILHPEDQTDSFTLYIKACILLSRVKDFNLRFAIRRHYGDPGVAFVPPREGEVVHPRAMAQNLYEDPCRSVAFIELDTLVTSFQPSFPPRLRNSMPDGVVDSHLYVARLIANM